MLRLAALAILILTALPVAAADCGNGLPCGPVPWNLPVLPTLISPTPMPTFFFTATPSPTATPTNFTPSPTNTPTNTPTATFTPSPTPTNTPFFDQQELLDQIETLQAIIDATEISVLDPQGTPVNVENQLELAADPLEELFGRTKGYLQTEWGPFQPVATAVVVAITVTFALIALTYTFPLVGFLLGMIRKIYTAVMDALPT